MKRQPKIFTILLETKQGIPREVTGNLEYLVDYFSYTLQVGNEYNKSINCNPKTIKSLITNYNRAEDVKKSGSFNRYYISIKQ